ncbi:MAG: DUF4383 domain-containing protein [Actinomycetota bacterium]
MGKSFAHTFAFLGGVVYLIAGVAGFVVTGFGAFVGDSPDALFTLDLNPFHNVVHLGIGAMLLAAARIDEPGVTQGILTGGGLVLVLAAILGFLGSLDQLLSVDGTMASDNFLHAITGVGAIVAGSTSAEPMSGRSAQPTGG